MHLATDHQIWARAFSYKIDHESLPVAQFDLASKAFVADPTDWKVRCEKLWVQEWYKAGGPVPYPPRDNIIRKLASPSSTAAIHPAGTGERYDCKMIDVKALVASKYGYCIFCVWDDALCWSSRLQHFTQPKLRQHVIENHILPIYVAEREQDPVVQNGQSSADDKHHIHRCPDQYCSASSIAFDALGSYSHLVRVHPFEENMVPCSRDSIDQPDDFSPSKILSYLVRPTTQVNKDSLKLMPTWEPNRPGLEQEGGEKKVPRKRATLAEQGARGTGNRKKRTQSEGEAQADQEDADDGMLVQSLLSEEYVCHNDLDGDIPGEPVFLMLADEHPDQSISHHTYSEEVL